MGTSSSVYVGVHLSVCSFKTKETYNIRACVNKTCKKHKQDTKHHFCPNCGSQIEATTITKKVDFSLWRWLDENDFTDQLAQLGDLNIWVPNQDTEKYQFAKHIGGIDSEILSLKDLNADQEIETFKEMNKKIFDALDRAHITYECGFSVVPYYW